jgi:UDP-N-acetylmuramoyl-tripeptide--D-alanyl-D-alanine ligase
VARAKGELLDSLGANDTAVLNRDDDFFADWSQRIGNAKLLSFGMSADADFRAENIRLIETDGEPAFEFLLATPSGELDIVLRMAGQHNVINALAATAAAMAGGASLEDVRTGLAASSNVPGRLRAFRSTQGAMIFDDSYNANPDSVAAAIAFLEGLDDEPWLVLGDMGELGPDAAALHRGMGELARDAGIRGLLCVGELSRETAAGFGSAAQWFESVDELETSLRGQLTAGRNVLIKGSRFMGLDRVVRHLVPTPGEEGA